MLEIFKEAFEDGASFNEAVNETGIPASDELVRYWKLLVMEKALDEAAIHFERLLEPVGEVSWQ